MKLLTFAFWLLLFSEKLYSYEYIGNQINKTIDEINTPQSMEISRIQEGETVRIEWLGVLIYIYHRTEKDIQQLEGNKVSLLADPNDTNTNDSLRFRYFSSSSGPHTQVFKAGFNMIQSHKLRSVDNKFLVIGGLDPSSGCALTYLVETEVRFRDPCSSRTYDAAGRLFKKNKENKTFDKKLFNLRPVPYFITDNDLMVLGLKGGYKSLPEVDFDFSELYSSKTPSQKLATAALFNDKKTILEMLEKGADIEYFNGTWPPPPLVAAIFGSDLDIITLLIKKGALKTKLALHHAKSTKRKDVVLLLSNKK